MSLTVNKFLALGTEFPAAACRGVLDDAVPAFCRILSNALRAELMTAIVCSDTGLPTLHTTTVGDIKRQQHTYRDD